MMVGCSANAGQHYKRGARRRREQPKTHLRIPASSIFRRFGTDLRDELEGLIVLDERPLSVLELVTEL